LIINKKVFLETRSLRYVDNDSAEIFSVPSKIIDKDKKPRHQRGFFLFLEIPDHLGSTSYITNKNDSISQHVDYIAFGEVLFEEHSSSFSSPYLFNGKELDRETNLSYYGARYLDMKTSLWLNIDPLAEDFPNVSSYVYCLNNPIRLVDPDGENPILGALIGAFTEYAGIVGSKMIFDGMTFVEANKSLGINDGLDIAVAAGFGAASGAIDGGITKFASWIKSPTNQKIIIKLLEVGVSALESSLKQIYKDEEFDLLSILTGALTEVGMGSLLKTDIYKEAADKAGKNASVSVRRAEDLAARRKPNAKLIKNAKKEAAEHLKTEKAMKQLDNTGKVITGTAAKTAANKTQDASKTKKAKTTEKDE
jgi:RHS repeat-associated protein